jgi:methylthioribose-1-phosphate isomerase
MLAGTRPTAVNLAWAVNRVLDLVRKAAGRDEALYLARDEALAIIADEKKNSLMIGKNGLPLIKKISKEKGGAPVNILTHCNAGWLACIDYGTATAPVYLAHDEGIRVHVIVDETRPRNQGARLTAWSWEAMGVPVNRGGG